MKHGTLLACALSVASIGLLHEPSTKVFAAPKFTLNQAMNYYKNNPDRARAMCAAFRFTNNNGESVYGYPAKRLGQDLVDPTDGSYLAGWITGNFCPDVF